MAHVHMNYELARYASSYVVGFSKFVEWSASYHVAPLIELVAWGKVNMWVDGWLLKLVGRL
jgi:hypothetical protein